MFLKPGSSVCRCALPTVGEAKESFSFCIFVLGIKLQETVEWIDLLDELSTIIGKRSGLSLIGIYIICAAALRLNIKAQRAQSDVKSPSDVPMWVYRRTQIRAYEEEGGRLTASLVVSDATVWRIYVWLQLPASL